MREDSFIVMSTVFEIIYILVLQALDRFLYPTVQWLWTFHEHNANAKAI
jgi:hypothetical protein